MVVLRSFALILFVYAVVAMEATVSNHMKVGEKNTRKSERKTKERKVGNKSEQVRGSVPKLGRRSGVIVRR